MAIGDYLLILINLSWEVKFLEKAKLENQE
jgi:hypothetical protein